MKTAGNTLAIALLVLDPGCSSEPTIDPNAPACTREGEQAECSAGSVCVAAYCWIECDPTDASACNGLPWAECKALIFGGTEVYVCQE